MICEPGILIEFDDLKWRALPVVKWQVQILLHFSGWLGEAMPNLVSVVVAGNTATGSSCASRIHAFAYPQRDGVNATAGKVGEAFPRTFLHVFDGDSRRVWRGESGETV